MSFEEARMKAKVQKTKEWGVPSLGNLLEYSHKAKTAPKSTLKRGSMTKPIPLKMREELANDPFMKNCCLRVVGFFRECNGEIQWHHALSYAGRRQNEKGSILPVCKYHHEKEAQFRKQLNAIMYTRMTDADRAKYPRKKWL